MVVSPAESGAGIWLTSGLLWLRLLPGLIWRRRLGKNTGGLLSDIWRKNERKPPGGKSPEISQNREHKKEPKMDKTDTIKKNHPARGDSLSVVCY